MSDTVLVHLMEAYLKDSQDKEFFGSLGAEVQMKILEAIAKGRAEQGNTFEKFIGVVPNREFKLSASSMGKCPRSIWLKLNGSVAPPFPPRTKMTFAMGDTFESLLVTLIRVVGILHPEVTVREELIQTEVIDPVTNTTGHFDIPITINGVNYLGEVKVMASYSYDRAKKNGPDDEGGYPHQANHGCRALEAHTGETWDRILWLMGNKNTGHFGEAVTKCDHPKYTPLAQSTLVAADGDSRPNKPPFAVTEDNSQGTKIKHWKCTYCGEKEDCWGPLRMVVNSRGQPEYYLEVR